MGKKGYSSLENALRILELFNEEETHFNVKTVASRLNIANSTAHRLLSTLKLEGFLVQDARNHTYRLGVSTRGFEAVIMEDLELYHAAEPILRALVKKLQATVSLCILYEGETFYLHTEYSGRAVEDGWIYPRRTQPLLASSAGGALVSDRDQYSLQALYEEEKEKRFMTAICFKWRDLLQIEKKGFAISRKNFGQTLTSIAAPVKNRQGSVIAAIELIAPSRRISASNVDAYTKAVREASQKLEDTFGASKITS